MRTFLTMAAFLGAMGAARADVETLSMRAVDEVVERHDRAVQACGRGVGHRGDTVAVMVTLTVGADGRVADAQAGKHDRVGACLERVARKMVFPATGTT